MKTSTKIYKTLPQDEHNTMGNKQIVSHSKGSLVWMKSDEQPYIDLVMGYSSANFGHLNDEILSALENVKSDNVVFFRDAEKELLIDELGELLELEGNWNFYFPVGGALVVEAAARACLLAKPNGKLLSFKGAFHGHSGVSRALTDERFLRRDVFTDGFETVKCSRPIDAGSNSLSLKELEKYLKKGNIAGVFIEPIQGASGFINFGIEFMINVRAICTKYDVPLVCDEIQTGFFRCGGLTVCQDMQIIPDILLLGKSLGGGLVPISAVVINNNLIKKIPTDRTAFDSTFSGWTLGVTVARNVLKYIQKNNFKKVVAEKGLLIDEILDKNLPIGLRKRIRRTGLAIGYDGTNSKECENIRKKMLTERIIIQTAGLDGSKNKLAPSLTIPNETLVNCINKYVEVIKNEVKN